MVTEAASTGHANCTAGPVNDDVMEPGIVHLRHPSECLPYRPRPKPVWIPARRDSRDAGQPRRIEAPTRKNLRLVADRSLGAKRINFRYAGYQPMVAGHSEKAGRDQYFEGSHEAYGFRLHEIDPTYLDLQYQPIEVAWTTPVGKQNHITLDWGVEIENGSVVFGEDKADEAYFEDPEISERLDMVEAFLETQGAFFERRVAGSLPTFLARRAVKNVYDYRRTAFDEEHVSRVQSLIRGDGGTSTMGRVIEAIGEHAALSESIVYGMMHKRLVRIPIATPPMPDTPVTIPPAATKGALRAFLAANVPHEGDAA